MTLSFRQLREFYGEHTHVIPGIQPGTGTTTSVPPDPSFGGIGGSGGGAGAGTGDADVTFTAVATSAMVAGTPVYINRATGQLQPADQAATLTALVVGMLVSSVAAGFVATYSRQTMLLADWTAIIGRSTLQPGLVYFLGSNGMLTTTQPVSGTSARVGQALTATRLAIFPVITPILL